MDALQRHGGSIQAIVPALQEWFVDGYFRGCAFINSVSELGSTLPEVVKITQRHKEEMTFAIENLLPASKHRQRNAQPIALAIDGAIIRAQIDQSPVVALSALERLLMPFLPE